MMGETLIGLAEDVFAEGREYKVGQAGVKVFEPIGETEQVALICALSYCEMAQLNDIASGNVAPVRQPEGKFDPRKKLSKEEFTEMCGHCKYRGDG